MTAATSRDIYWRPVDEPGLEHLHIDFSAAGMRAVGLILRKLGDAHLRCRYELESDAAWKTRKLTFAVMPSGAGGGKRLALESDGQGNWSVDGVARPELAGCLDPDIQISPFTNTLPIRRLDLADGADAVINAVYVPLPDLEPRAAAQRYTCLEKRGPNGGRYRYDDAAWDFTAELPVDGDGLVIDYPDLFERVWPR